MTYSAVSCTSTGELHERISAPHGLLRRSLEQHLGRAVTTGTGATGARARVRPQRRRLRVRLDADVAPTARTAVEQRAAQVLEQLIGPDRSQIRVRIRRRERVA